MLDPTLSSALDPNKCSHEQLLDGSFVDNMLPHLSTSEQTWIPSLWKIVTHDISLSLSIDDFKKFFKAKQERTASSPSGCHMGPLQIPS
jgi:hypothetical protein